MTPKKYANEMVEKMRLSSLKTTKKDAKNCALIAVNEILSQFTWKPSNGTSYWEEVKQEIEKL